MIDISIIVPSYNAEKSIDKCITSLINQTKKELEFIIINDGSTDSTEEIIKKYKDKRIKYFKNKNSGIGKTRNFGIEKAKGKYLMFVDSDDYLENDACFSLFNKIEKSNSDVVVSNFYKVYDNRKESINILEFNNCTLEEKPDLINIVNTAPWNKIYRTSLIKDNNVFFPENIKYEDAPFVLECLDKASKISQIDEDTYNYVIHNNSETTVRDEKVFDIFKIIDMIRIYFSDKDYMKEELDYYIVSMLMNYNIQQRNQKDKKIGMKFIDESFDYLNKYVPNYRNNKYFKKRSKVKGFIEKHKNVSKIYCRLYIK